MGKGTDRRVPRVDTIAPTTEQTITASGQTSAKRGKSSTISDQTSFASTTSDKTN